MILQVTYLINMYLSENIKLYLENADYHDPFTDVKDKETDRIAAGMSL